MKLFLAAILFLSFHAKAEQIDYPLPEQSKTEKDADVQKQNSAPTKAEEESLLQDDPNDPILKAEKEQLKPHKKIDKQELKSEEEEDKTELSKLGELAPFSDVAVIQRRYLPKTSRFEFFPNLGIMVNNPFFMNTALSARLAYGISEKLAVEADFMYIMSTKQKITNDLANQPHSVVTASFITPQAFYGADIKWSPIYGKMGYFNKSIVPFDMYFSGGAGIMNTNQGTSPIAFHFGTGQTYALSKKWAFRWDVSAYFYNSSTTTVSQGAIQGNFTDIYVNMGVCLFFPEATYR